MDLLADMNEARVISKDLQSLYAPGFGIFVDWLTAQQVIRIVIRTVQFGSLKQQLAEPNLSVFNNAQLDSGLTFLVFGVVRVVVFSTVGLTVVESSEGWKLSCRRFGSGLLEILLRLLPSLDVRGALVQISQDPTASSTLVARLESLYSPCLIVQRVVHRVLLMPYWILLLW